MNQDLINTLSKYLPFNPKIRYMAFGDVGIGRVTGLKPRNQHIFYVNETHDSTSEHIIVPDYNPHVQLILIPLEDISRSVLSSLSPVSRRYIKSWLFAHKMTNEDLKFDVNRITGEDLDILIESKFDVYRMIPRGLGVSVDVFDTKVYGFEESRLR
jgi:hypothetical protein